jgi:hypothetical protein
MMPLDDRGDCYGVLTVASVLAIWTVGRASAKLSA